MNILDLYPPATTPGTSYLTETTDVVTSISYTDAETIAEPYYMGYINWDDVPDTLKTSYFEFVSDLDNDFFECRDISIPENIPWFFTGKYFTSASNQMHIIYYPYDNATDKYIVPSNTLGLGEFRFLNRGTIPELSSSGNVLIHFTTCAINKNVTPNTYTTSNASNSENDHYMTFPQFLDFLKDQYTLTISFTKYSETFTVTLKCSDLKDGYYIFDTPLGNTLKIFITDFRLPTTDRDIDNQGTLRYWSTVQAGVLMHYDDPRYGVRPVVSNSNHWSYTSGNYLAINYNNKSISNARNYSPMDYRILRGGWRCKVPGTFFRNAESGRCEIYGNCVIYRASSTNYQLFRLFTPTEIYHNFSALFTRICTSSVEYGFSNNVYVPLFNEDNSPKWEFANGALSDIQDKLRIWQYDDITDNDFEPDDIPEYTPPTPGDDTADSGGDTIAPYDFTNTPLSAANNFTTLYALSTAQVAAFGSIMWASLSDPNFWHAVGVEFTNDFSINPADMMRYFNFLRYYPFDLTPYSSQYISGIYIGRSTIPLQFPAGMEYPRRASRNLIQINGGEVTALLPAPYNSDDFFVSDPATQMQAHIPFCGTVQLSAAECYGRTLYLNYVVDLQSGAIQATISVQSDSYYIVATLAGTCGAGVQITANNNIEYLTRIATVATGGISSAATMATRGAQVAGAEGAAAAGVVGALTGTVSALAGLPPVTVHKQGSTTGFANYGGDPRAYVTIQAPKRSIPDTYAKSAGYVSNKRARIGDLSGYTEMINPDLSGIAAHQDELAEIYRILQAGFFA